VSARARIARTVFLSLIFATLTLSARAMPGDSCQCGDVNNDRAIGVGDVVAFRAWLASPTGAPFTPAGFDKCNVAGGNASACNVLDLTVLRRGLESLGPGIAPTCDAQYGTDGNLVRFAAFGAQGDGSAGQLAVANALREVCLDRCCDFVQLLGDNVLPNGVTSSADPQFATKFETPYASVDLPFWAVLGNHDYGGSGAGNEFEKGPYQVEYSALSSAKFELPALYWHRTVKHVHMLGLDSTKTLWSMDAAQRLEIDAWLNGSSATWQISAGMHCYRSNGAHGNAGCYDSDTCPNPLPVVNGATVKTFYESLVCGRVDLALCAYDRNMQWLQDTCAGTELVVAGAGASVTLLEDVQPAWFEGEQLGFLYVEIDGNTLTAEFIDTAGNTLFARTLTK